MHQLDPVTELRQPLPCRRQSHLIPVNADERSRGELCGDPTGVARAAQGAVHIDSFRLDVQPLDAFLQQDGNMMKFTHRPIASKDASSFSGVRFSFSNRANSAASQISA